MSSSLIGALNTFEHCVKTGVTCFGVFVKIIYFAQTYEIKPLISIDFSNMSLL